MYDIKTIQLGLEGVIAVGFRSEDTRETNSI